MPIGTKNSVIKGGGSHHIAIMTKNWDESLKLYRDVLGMSERATFGSEKQKIMLLDIGDGSHIELFEPRPDDPDEALNYPIIHFALATSDARAATEHVRQAGYEITVEPKDVNLGGLEATIAFFKGPCGEIIEFFEEK